MVIVFDEDLLQHIQWPDHPESPLRLKTIMKKLEHEGLLSGVRGPDPIDESAVLKVHAPEYIERLKKGGNTAINADMFLSDNTYDLALLSASVAVTAVRCAMDGIPSIALSRPPGHHAGKGSACGFCYLNNAAIAAEAAGVRTVIVDVDVHHCNGTEEIFYDRDDVMVISIHESRLFPNTGRVEDIGAGKGEGYNINIPIPSGSGNKTYETAMNDIIVPMIRDFGPELMIVSLGVDAHYCDPLGHMLLNTQGYIDICRRLYDESKGGRIAVILEGGYHLRATAEVLAGIAAMFDCREIKPEYGEDKGDQSNGVREVRKAKEFFREQLSLRPR